MDYKTFNLAVKFFLILLISFAHAINADLSYWIVIALILFSDFDLTPGNHNND